ncbi:MAG: restriction endonuclease subunit S [Amaricoccus sp.]|uniref:restriction endonuclease subunit S n=1 Tax=Amaricoccus sp. TaxID=1872485 RepID=UPI003315254E
MGNVALAVNRPDVPAPAGWKWVPLTSIARMESGHTPSRKHPEYWGGDIPWLGIRDAKAAHGGTITETAESTNALGINNSSARVLPAGTICLSRTASVGYVVKMGRDMATSQDFANWVCSDLLDPDFLRYLLIAESSALSRFSSGSIHQTIYYPELKAFYVCVPSPKEQKRIVAVLDQAFAALDHARSHAEANLADASALRAQSANELLQRATRSAERKPLAVLAEFRNGLNFSRHSSGDHVRVVGVGDFQKNFWVPIEEIKESQIEGRLSEQDKLRHGDIVAVRSNGNRDLIGRVMLVRHVHGDVSFSGFVIRVRLLSKAVLPEYLCHYMKSPDAVAHLHAGGGGANISNLNQGTLSALSVPVPCIEVQSNLVEDIHLLNDRATQLQAEIEGKFAGIATLRQAVLQRAFAGQLI